MYDAFSRMENLLGTKGVKRLGSAKIAVFGIGGIGSYVVEALARCGVGSLTLVDHEDISLTDINRQLYALRSAIDQQKRTPVSGSFFVSSYRRCGVQDKLTENTDQSASQECFQHV